MSKPTDSDAWTDSKAYGDAGEQWLTRFFRLRGFDVAKLVEPASEYDLLIQGRIEVKHDRKATKTGNVAVEVSYRGKPSGIMATTSTLWAIVLGDEYLIVPTKRLREFITANQYTECSAGDGGKASVVLVPLSDLRQQPFVRRIRREREA